MCGIAGIVGMRTVNMHAVRAMTDVLAHRGPDGEGIWQSDDARVGLGHRRLAIIDVTDNAAQPMLSSNRRLAITYNGEIYNYKELRSELTDQGSRFRTESDTEVILESYLRWGDDCVNRLNGMFAFAIYDADDHSLFLARDRFGEKPLLYSHRDGFFAFASEYKSLLLLDPVSSNIDDLRLMRFLVDPTDALDQYTQTIFDDIHELRPAETIRLSLHDLSCVRRTYWHPEENSEFDELTIDEAANRFRALLEDSIRIRLRSDVPVGSCLSGGLDSSAITYLAQGYRDQSVPYHVFTGRFPDTGSDEGEWARLVADETGVRQHETIPTGERLVDEIGDFVWYNELPVDSASQFGQWCVFKKASETGVTVLLDGQGSDEVLAGYEQYFAAYLRGLTDSDREKQEIEIRQRYPEALSMHDSARVREMPIGLKRLMSRILKRGSSVLLGMKSDFAAQLAYLESPKNEPGNLSSALKKDAMNGFLTTLLRYGDRNSMAHSREVRLPFCDHRLIEFVSQLPPQHLMGEAQTKRLLRESMRGVLPEKLRTRWRKQGFQPPISQWLDGELMSLVKSTFSDPAFGASPYWDVSWWTTAVRRFEDGERTLAPTLWKAFITRQWETGFLDRVRQSSRLAPFSD